MAAAPTPIPVTVGQSVPVTGMALGVPWTTCVGTGVAEEVAVGVGVAAPHAQSLLETQSGLRQKPDEQISPV